MFHIMVTNLKCLSSNIYEICFPSIPTRIAKLFLYNLCDSNLGVLFFSFFYYFCAVIMRAYYFSNMNKVLLLGIILAYNSHFAYSQIRLPLKFYTKIMADVTKGDLSNITYLGIIGDGSFVNSSTDISNGLNTGGGFFFGKQLGIINTKNNRTKYLSLFAKYKPINSFKKISIADSASNKDLTAKGISEKLFSFDNLNNISFSIRYNSMKKISNNSGRSNFSVFADVYLTWYKIDTLNLDTSLWGGKKISPGFYNITPNIGITQDWVWKTGEHYFMIGFSTSASGAFIYENEKGSKYFGSWDYLNRYTDAISNPSNDINWFMNFTSKLNFQYNDVTLFLSLQKPLSGVKSEIVGVNNRSVFFNFGVGFAPGLVNF